MILLYKDNEKQEERDCYWSGINTSVTVKIRLFYALFTYVVNCVISCEQKFPAKKRFLVV